MTPIYCIIFSTQRSITDRSFQEASQINLLYEVDVTFINQLADSSFAHLICGFKSKKLCVKKNSTQILQMTQIFVT